MPTTTSGVYTRSRNSTPSSLRITSIWSASSKSANGSPVPSICCLIFSTCLRNSRSIRWDIRSLLATLVSGKPIVLPGGSFSFQINHPHFPRECNACIRSQVQDAQPLTLNQVPFLSVPVVSRGVEFGLFGDREAFDLE